MRIKCIIPIACALIISGCSTSSNPIISQKPVAPSTEETSQFLLTVAAQQPFPMDTRFRNATSFEATFQNGQVEQRMCIEANSRSQWWTPYSARKINGEWVLYGVGGCYAGI